MTLPPFPNRSAGCLAAARAFSGLIAEQLRTAGHDVLAVVPDPALATLSDDQILTRR
jgi:hypothetical protein